jgi:tetratricopeptide (TPR) repeat protein
MWDQAKPLIPFRRLLRHVQAHHLPEAAGTRFTILIADLDNDDAGHQTQHVQFALERLDALDVVRYGKVLREPSIGNVRDRQQQAEADGRRWLAEKNGDLLIWGRAEPGGKVLRLRFLARDEGAATPRAANRELGTDLTLPADFHGDLAAALHSVVLASLRPASEKQGHFVAELLEPAVAKTQRLLASPPAQFDGAMRAGVLFWYGYAAGTLGEQRGSNDWLDRSIGAFRELLAYWTRERVPLDWATTQNNLGNALRALGERETGTERLEEAVAAYRAALLERTRERVPLDWAMTQNNLGAALANLGVRETGTARLEEAVAAYRAALLERTRERVPLDWAMTQNNLGAALANLGERETGAERLEEAVAAYRAAMLEWTRERVPLDWAGTQNNLGAALANLGVRETGTARLEEAVAAYRAALEVLRAAKAQHYIDMTNRNLARAEKLLAERRAQKR